MSNAAQIAEIRWLTAARHTSARARKVKPMSAPKARPIPTAIKRWPATRSRPVVV